MTSTDRGGNLCSSATQSPTRTRFKGKFIIYPTKSFEFLRSESYTQNMIRGPSAVKNYFRVNELG